ncbi:MAG: hypothetical protein ACYC6O_10295 [Thermoleophilia bacterium]
MPSSPRKGNWLPLLAAVLLVIVAMGWFITEDFSLADKIQLVSSEDDWPVGSGHELVQTITANQDEITRIDLVMGRKQPYSGGEMRVQIVESGDADQAGVPAPGEVLSETVLDTSSYDYNAIRRIEFDPVKLVPGRTYAIRLTSDDSLEEAVIPGSSKEDSYEGGQLFYDGKPEDADLFFAFYHSDGADGLLQKMEPWRPFPLNSRVFVVILFAAGAAAFGWLLYVIAATDPPAECDGETRRQAGQAKP